MSLEADIAAWVCTVTPTTTVRITNQQGEALQQLCLAAIDSVDSALADALHDKSGHQLRAYATSDLHHLNTNTSLRGTVQSGERAWFRLVGLQRPIVEALAAYFQHGPTEVTINHQQWSVEAVTADHAEHPWAGHTTYQALMSSFHDAEPPTHLKLNFITPASFTSKGIDVPLPIPTLIFGSLERQWRELTGFNLPRELNPYLEYFVAVEDARIETQSVYIQNAPHLGFTGYLHLELLKSNERLKKDAQRYPEAEALATFLKGDARRRHDLARAMGLLAGFGFYSGVGRKTSQGMGMLG